MNAHILAIDAGNTRIKWGLHDGSEWTLRGTVPTAEFAGSNALVDLQKVTAVDRVVISNVVGQSVADAIKLQLKPFDLPVSFVGAVAEQCRVVNYYDNPADLGADRWAALIGAHAAAAETPRAQLVVMSGTALTVDALTADGRFLGGIIVPGLKLMQRALNRGTAQLPDAPGEYRTFPRSTLNAIATGAIEACAGAVARMYTHLSVQLGEAPYCVGSGGALPVLAPHLPFPVSINDNLVLDGLLAIAKTS